MTSGELGSMPATSLSCPQPTDHGALEVYAHALEDGVERYLRGRPTKIVYRRFNQPEETPAP
jgi:hypothetical protein